jgi:hypothetical protein
MIELQWWIHAHHLNLIFMEETSNCRNVKVRVDLNSIIHVSWHPSLDTSKQTPKGFLYIVYRDIVARTVRPLFLADFGSLSDFADFQQLLPPAIAHSGDENDPMTVLSHTPPFQDTTRTPAIWRTPSSNILFLV